MSDESTKLYETMFLINPAAVAGDIAAAQAHVQEMLDRAEAEVLTLHRWDERKLAYPIEGMKRGTFLLGLFNVRPVQIANIERDCNLSEIVSRVLFIRADHMGEIEIKETLEGAQKAADESAIRKAGSGAGAGSVEEAAPAEPVAEEAAASS